MNPPSGSSILPWPGCRRAPALHSAIVARIGRVLADRIDEVAAELVNVPTAIREGLVQDDELVRLEGYCLEAHILSLDLNFDVIPVKDGVAPAAPWT